MQLHIEPMHTSYAHRSIAIDDEVFRILGWICDYMLAVFGDERIYP